ncbi:MAG TPA: sugar ABC transporter permease [Roseiflexaceae bacterium]|nr:sugar ABC transporter permease [Roseiflexaceae bacterium]
MTVTPRETTDTRPSQILRPRFAWLSDAWLVRLFLAPTMALLLLIAIFPLIWSLYLSFTQYSVIKDADTGPVWVGLANYARLLSDKNIWARFTTTAAFVVPAVAIELLLGFALALLLNREFYGRGVFMTLMLIPMMLSPVVVALFWRFMLRADTGIVNWFIRDLLPLSEKGVFWLTDLKVAIWSVVLVDVWMWTPFMMLITLAGLSAVPKYLYEAAAVDRASSWFKFRHITLPIIAPLVLIGLLFRLIDTYRVFDTVYALTGGGPGRATQVLSIYIYQVAFRDFNTGMGSALGYIMLVVIIALANLLIRLLHGIRAEG